MAASLHILEGSGSLAHRVAGHLLESVRGVPFDLRDTHVWVPTAGAERRVRRALAEHAARSGTGLLAPRFLQVSQALIPESATIASRIEREGAWAQVLAEARLEERDAVVPDNPTWEGPPAWLGAGALLCELCDLLAEGGYEPGDPRVAEACGDDSARWEQIPPLYRRYLDRLKRAGLADPNKIRLKEALVPTLPADIKRVVVACIPDLSPLAARYLDALTAKGVKGEILVAGAGDGAGNFDRWGRPVPENWRDRPVPIEASQIVVAREAADEAELAVWFASEAEPSGDYALVVVDPAKSAAMSAAIWRCGGRPFLPEGRSLAESEAAIIALQWHEWSARHELRVLRRLLQCPRLLQWLGRQTGLKVDEILSGCDFLIAETLAETLEQAQTVSWIVPDNGTPSRAWMAAKALVELMPTLNEVPFPEMLRRIWSKTAEGAEAAAQVLELWRQVSNSPLYLHWREGVWPGFVRALRAARMFETSDDAVVELSGWLEAPWLEASRLAVCGCGEGALPASVNEHPFLPDSRRRTLGLPDNEKRFARDAYLIRVLLVQHDPANLQFSFSRYGADGSPALPSRLLLQCASEDLPKRILQTFGEGCSVSRRPERRNGWRWNLPDGLRQAVPSKISPTGFKDYLACPFRFYLRRVLHLEAFDADAREMDALRFGTLVHAALESFARTAPDESRREKIEALVLDRFAAEALRVFGSNPSPAVRVQWEAAKVRLRAFARVQAEEAAKGWRIVEVEREIEPEETTTIGALTVSAKIDRIEKHPDLGVRIMDYKTYAAPKTPAETHLSSLSTAPVVPEAVTSVNGRMRQWTDLQLPIYRLLGERLYPGLPVQTAYFVLTADPESSEILPFVEMDDTLYASALKCAEAVANRVRNGKFWPPQEHHSTWTDPFAPWFLNGRPEECFRPEMIAFLEGAS